MSVTINELDELCKQAYKLDNEWEEINEKLKEKNRELEEVKAKILAHFEASDKEKYSIKGLGTLYTHNRFSVTVPRGEQKAVFFNYLKDRGIFEEMITVNSMTLNSFFQEEMRIALEAGDDTFKMPGIDEPKLVKTLKLRKA